MATGEKHCEVDVFLSTAPSTGAQYNSAILVLNIPHSLIVTPQWVVWRKVWDAERSKDKKVPYNPRTKREAKSNDPTTWAPFEEAVAAYERGGFDGIGFVFSTNDPVVGIDLDGCRDPETGLLKPWASDIVARLDSYTEASPSGTGVHVIAKGTSRCTPSHSVLKKYARYKHSEG